MQKKSSTRNRSLVIAVLAVATLMVAGSAVAQGQGRREGAGKGRGIGPGHRLEFLAERLELTEEQVAAIKGIREAGQEENMALRKELMQLNHDLKGEMMKDEPSEKAALALVQEIGSVRTEMEANRLRNRLKVREQLTPGQQDKMLMLKERHGGRKRGGEGRACRTGGRRANGHQRGDCDGSGGGRGPRTSGEDQ